MAAAQLKSKIDHQLSRAKELHRNGQLSEAQKQYEKLLKKTKGNAQVLNLLGGVLLQQEKYDRALEILRRAVAKSNQDADLNYNLGLSYYNLNDFDGAVAAFERAVELEDQHDRAYYMLAKSYLSLDSKQFRMEAFNAYLKDIEITDRIDSHVMVADILHELGRHADSRGVAKGVLERDPANEIALWVMAKSMIAENYGKVNVDIKAAEPIVKIASIILKTHPNSWRGHHVMAEALTMIGEDELAVKHYDRLKEIKPSMAAARTSAGVLMLRQGRLKEGWDEIAYRKQFGEKLFGMNANILESCPAPRWEGQLEQGKSILVVSEQGIGDQILHAQILKDLLDAGMNIHMTCTPKIVSLMSRSLPQVSIYPSDQEIPEKILNELDFKAELLDLGKYLRDDLSKFGDPFYFLKPDPALAAEFEAKYQQFGDKLKVGISWKSTSKSIGKLKSTELKQWKDILSQSGVQFVSIQYGDIDEDLSSVEDLTESKIYVDDFNPFKDIEKAVAQISALDMVISVSNASVHMSGQLGVPTWVLLNQRTLWHWFNDTEDTVWYKNYKLYRQKQLESWDPVFKKVELDMNQYINNRSRMV